MDATGATNAQPFGECRFESCHLLQFMEEQKQNEGVDSRSNALGWHERKKQEQAKEGSTVHAVGCPCGFCKAGFTKA